MRLSKAEKITLELGKGISSSSALLAFVISMLPARAGEYIDAIIGFTGVFSILTAVGFIPFAVASIITTIYVRTSSDVVYKK